MSDMPGATAMRSSAARPSGLGDLGYAGARKELDPGPSRVQRDRDAGRVHEAQRRADLRSLPGSGDDLAVAQDPDLARPHGDVQRRGVAGHVADARAADADLHDHDVLRLDARP